MNFEAPNNSFRLSFVPSSPRMRTFHVLTALLLAGSLSLMAGVAHADDDGSNPPPTPGGGSTPPDNSGTSGHSFDAFCPAASPSVTQMTTPSLDFVFTPAVSRRVTQTHALFFDAYGTPAATGWLYQMDGVTMAGSNGMLLPFFVDDNGLLLDFSGDLMGYAIPDGWAE